MPQPSDRNASFSERHMQGFKQWLQEIGIPYQNFEDIEIDLDPEAAGTVVQFVSELLGNDMDEAKYNRLINILTSNTIRLDTDLIYKIATASVAFQEYEAKRAAQIQLQKQIEEQMREEGELGADEYLNPEQIPQKYIPDDMNDMMVEENNEEEIPDDNDVIDFEKFLRRKQDEKDDNNYSF